MLEPPTAGKVILHTTHGPLDIELWSKECPKACRNFVQLCLDGYYDNCLFHRIISNFIVQTGDPTGTGFGGASIYGDSPFPVETHPRLAYRYRGLVGLASLDPDAVDTRDPDRDASRKHGSQFFITLSRADGLNRINTLFGKVTGNSLYNLLNLADTPVDSKTDRPLDPPQIRTTEVLFNPFPELTPRPGSRSVLQQEAAERELQAAANRRHGKNIQPLRDALCAKKKGLLSFAADEDSDEENDQDDVVDSEPPTAASLPAKSDRGHPVSSAAGTAVADTPHRIATDHAGKADKLLRLKERVTRRMEGESTTVNSTALGGEPKTDHPVAATSEGPGDTAPTSEESDSEGVSDSDDSDDSDETSSDSASEQELRVVTESRVRRNAELSRLKKKVLDFKKGQGTANQDIRDQERMQDANLLTDYEKRRQYYLGRRQQTSKRQRQDEVLRKFQEFQKTLHRVSHSSSVNHPHHSDSRENHCGAPDVPLTVEQNDADDRLWYEGTGLRFAVDSARAYELDASKDSLVTYDPLATKSKAEVAEKMRIIQRERMKPSLRPSR